MSGYFHVWRAKEPQQVMYTCLVTRTPDLTEVQAAWPHPGLIGEVLYIGQALLSADVCGAVLNSDGCAIPERLAPPAGINLEGGPPG